MNGFRRRKGRCKTCRRLVDKRELVFGECFACRVPELPAATIQLGADDLRRIDDPDRHYTFTGASCTITSAFFSTDGGKTWHRLFEAHIEDEPPTPDGDRLLRQALGEEPTP